MTDMTTTAVPKRASGRPRTGRFSGNYQVVGDVQLSPEEEAVVQRQLEQLKSEPLPVSTALRWGRKQLEIVRRAAELAGVPYQTYLKQAAIRTAIQDLRAAREAGIDLP
jgi:predicted DNA binding CopG/RHH family protein